MRPNETYSKGKHQLSDRNRDVLINVKSSRKWWATLKSAGFGLSLALPPLVSGVGRLMSKLVGKADVLSDILDSTQSSESVDLPLTCHPSRSLTTIAFRSCAFLVSLQASPGRLVPLWWH